jgi:hypothetical protein
MTRGATDDGAAVVVAVVGPVVCVRAVCAVVGINFFAVR